MKCFVESAHDVSFFAGSIDYVGDVLAGRKVGARLTHLPKEDDPTTNRMDGVIHIPFWDAVYFCETLDYKRSFFVNVLGMRHVIPGLFTSQVKMGISKNPAVHTHPDMTPVTMCEAIKKICSYPPDALEIEVGDLGDAYDPGREIAVFATCVKSNEFHRPMDAERVILRVPMQHLHGLMGVLRFAYEQVNADVRVATTDAYFAMLGMIAMYDHEQAVAESAKA
jgi:hypothetical protein